MVLNGQGSAESSMLIPVESFGRKCGVRICCPLLGIAGKISCVMQQRLLHLLEQLRKYLRKNRKGFFLPLLICRNL